MKKVFLHIVITVFACISYAEENKTSFLIEFSAIGGYTKLPENVTGKAQGYSYYTPYSAGSLLDPETNRYSQVFTIDTRKNAGFMLGLLFYTSSGIGIGYELRRTTSITSSHDPLATTNSDTLTSVNSPIPYDYAIDQVASSVKYSIEQYSNGITVAYRHALTKNVSAGVQCGVGYLTLNQYADVHSDGVVRSYYQSNGHQVFAENIKTESDEQFVIAYSAAYVYPRICFTFALNSNIALNAGAGCLLASFDNGAYEDQNGNIEMILYPDNTFSLIDPSIKIGISFDLIGLSKKRVK